MAYKLIHQRLSDLKHESKQVLDCYEFIKRYPDKLTKEKMEIINQLTKTDDEENQKVKSIEESI